jgi:protein TonB
MRFALPGSLLLHAALLGWAWLALDWTPPTEETGVEATMVSIVTLEDFASEAVSTVQSSATQTLVASGAEAAEPVEEIELAELVEPVDTPPVRAATAELVESETLASLPVLTATTLLDAEPVAALRPVTTSPLAETVAATAPPPEQVAAINPVATASLSPEPLEALEESPLAPVPLQRPERFRQELAEVAPPKVTPRDAPRDRPKDPPKEAPKKKPGKQAAPAGNGGAADANVAAGKAAGSTGKSGAAGNAAVSKYPGLVQRALRRALRTPRGAGNARGEVHVTFVVSASGAASQIAVSRSSGHAVLDKEAIATVKRAAPFPPIPAEAGRSSWSFTMPLAFTR